MKCIRLFSGVVVLLSLNWGSGFIILNQVMAASSATVTAVVKVSVCGNGITEGGEQCDSSDLNSQSCSTRGFSGGVLLCTSACELNNSQCTNTNSGSSGGGGGTFSSPTPDTRITISGRAYPKSSVTILKDAQIAATTITGLDANFQVSIGGLSAGSYMFAVYSEDKNGNRSSLTTFPISLTVGATTTIGGVFIAPTVSTDKVEVKKGDTLTFFGQTVPRGEVSITVNSDEEFFVKTAADDSGMYLYNFDTTPLEVGQHFVKSKSTINNSISSFSKAVGFVVGNKNITPAREGVVATGDLNNDRRINLIDFSVAAYWYKRSSPPPLIDLNHDNKINLVDFSILAFYWTG